jgi:peroxiredoxin Q/BCP
VFVTRLTLTIAIVGLLLNWAGPALADDLTVGDVAPAFDLPGSDGRNHRLSEYLGKKAVVLAWFPKAFTPG